MTLQNRLDAAREVLTQHNSSIEGEEGKVDIDGFFANLAKMGGTSEAALSDATWEDLQDCGIPRILARSVSRCFRGAEEEKKQEPQKIVLDVSNDPEKHAASLTAVKLVDHFDPENHTNPYGKKLKDDTEGRRCLAFNKDGTLNVEITRGLVDEIVNLQYPEREEVTIEGIPSPTYRVGERPDRFASENPANPGTPLRPDGTSDAGCEWTVKDKEIPFNIRQLVYIAVESTGEADEDEMDIFDKVSGKTFAQVAKRYRKAAVEFGEREKLGTLPQLKIRLGGRGDHGGGGGGGKQDPFARGHRVW